MTKKQKAKLRRAKYQVIEGDEDDLALTQDGKGHHKFESEYIDPKEIKNRKKERQKKIRNAIGRVRNALLNSAAGAALGSYVHGGKSGYQGARVGATAGAIIGALQNPRKRSETADTLAAGGDFTFSSDFKGFRKEHQNPNGGLNAKGRAAYNKATGSNLKPPQPKGGKRRDSFCARMKGMKAKLTSEKTANDPNSRINKSLRAWACEMKEKKIELGLLAGLAGQMAVSPLVDKSRKKIYQGIRSRIKSKKWGPKIARAASYAPDAIIGGTASMAADSAWEKLKAAREKKREFSSATEAQTSRKERRRSALQNLRDAAVIGGAGYLTYKGGRVIQGLGKRGRASMRSANKSFRKTLDTARDVMDKNVRKAVDTARESAERAGHAATPYAKIGQIYNRAEENIKKNIPEAYKKGKIEGQLMPDRHGKAYQAGRMYANLRKKIGLSSLDKLIALAHYPAYHPRFNEDYITEKKDNAITDEQREEIKRDRKTLGKIGAGALVVGGTLTYATSNNPAIRVGRRALVGQLKKSFPNASNSPLGKQVIGVIKPKSRLKKKLPATPAARPPAPAPAPAQAAAPVVSQPAAVQQPVTSKPKGKGKSAKSQPTNVVAGNFGSQKPAPSQPKTQAPSGKKRGRPSKPRVAPSRPPTTKKAKTKSLADEALEEDMARKKAKAKAHSETKKRASKRDGKTNLSSRLHMILFGGKQNRGQLRSEEDLRFPNPIDAVTGGVKAGYIRKDQNNMPVRSVRDASGKRHYINVGHPDYKKGKTVVDPLSHDELIGHGQVIKGVYHKVNKASGVLSKAASLGKDTIDVVRGKPRDRDAWGRKKKREWEKSWFKKAAIGAAGTAGVLAYLKDPKRAARAGERLKKASKAVNSYLPDFFAMASKLEQRLNEFDETAPSWDIRDERGKSARVYAPGARPRVRREKHWHEKIENERKLWAAGILTAGLAGHKISRAVTGKAVKKAMRNRGRYTPKSNPASSSEEIAAALKKIRTGKVA